jgi:hypothetical protein
MNNNLTYSILQKNPNIKIQSAGCSCLLRMVVQQEFVCYYLDLVKRSQPSLPIFREVSATVATVLFFLSRPPPLTPTFYFTQTDRNRGCATNERKPGCVKRDVQQQSLSPLIYCTSFHECFWMHVFIQDEAQSESPGVAGPTES